MSKRKKTQSLEIKQSSEPHLDMALYAGHDRQFKIAVISMLWVEEVGNMASTLD